MNIFSKLLPLWKRVYFLIKNLITAYMEGPGPELRMLVEPKVRCTPDMMRVEVPHSPFTRTIYLQGLRDYPDPACKPRLDPAGTTSIFLLNLTDVHQCGITREVNQITNKKIYYRNVVVESLVQKGDSEPQVVKEVAYVKCTVVPKEEHVIQRRDILPAGFQEPDNLTIIQTLTEQAPIPVLGVGVRQNGNLVTGELNVSPGTPLQMEIYLDKNSSDVYGLLVTHMQVTDTKAQEETIIYNGCSVDPYLFENFNTSDGDFLTAKFRAFKFPESTYVQFRGTVNVCLDMCQGVECSDGKIGYGRKRREISTLPADPNKIFEITITSFIKVNYEDDAESLEEVIKTQKDVLKKFIVGNPVEKRIFKEIEESPSNLEITKLTEEEQITSILAENSASRNAAVLTVILCALRLFL